MKIAAKLFIDAKEYASQGNAVLGIRDSGKSYTATYLAERLMDDGIPIVAFDPIGIWRYLKVGKKEKGYPVVVAGGAEGDLPLTVENAATIVRAAMKENISLVLDLYSMELSKADWKRIVESCIRLLLYENKQYGLRHIFIEEAAEFCPQRVGPDQGRVYAEIEKLARMGGNASLGYTLINQRAEEVNKAVLELCDCLILHRQKGRHSLTALGKWLDVADTTNSKEIIKTLPSLDQGECWVWLQGSHKPQLVNILPKKTVHPDRRNPQIVAKSASVNVSAFVKRITKLMEEKESKKEAKPEEAANEYDSHSSEFERHEIENLQVQLEQAQELNNRWESWFGKIKHLVSGLWNEVVTAEGPPYEVNKNIVHGSKKEAMQVLEIDIDKLESELSPGKPKSSLPIGEQKILIALSQYPKGLRREQLTVLTGYKRSARDAYISRLTSKNYVQSEERGGLLRASQAGIKALGKNFTPLPKGNKLREHWLQTLPKGEAAILAILIRYYPKPFPREKLGELTGYQRSARDAYLSRMKAKEIVVFVQKGYVKASETLFE